MSCPEAAFPLQLSSLARRTSGVNVSASGGCCLLTLSLIPFRTSSSFLFCNVLGSDHIEISGAVPVVIATANRAGGGVVCLVGRQNYTRASPVRAIFFNKRRSFRGLCRFPLPAIFSSFSYRHCFPPLTRPSFGLLFFAVKDG